MSHPLAPEAVPAIFTNSSHLLHVVLTAASTCCLRTLGIFKVMNAYEFGSHFLRWALNDESRAAALDPARAAPQDQPEVANWTSDLPAQ